MVNRNDVLEVSIHGVSDGKSQVYLFRAQVAGVSVPTHDVGHGVLLSWKAILSRSSRSPALAILFWILLGVPLLVFPDLIAVLLLVPLLCFDSLFSMLYVVLFRLFSFALLLGLVALSAWIVTYALVRIKACSRAAFTLGELGGALVARSLHSVWPSPRLACNPL